MGTYCINELGALAYQPMQHERRLLLNRFYRHEAQGRTRNCFANCRGIGSIIFVPPDVRFDIACWHEPNIVTVRGKLACPMMC